MLLIAFLFLLASIDSTEAVDVAPHGQNSKHFTARGEGLSLESPTSMNAFGGRTVWVPGLKVSSGTSDSVIIVTVTFDGPRLKCKSAIWGNATGNYTRLDENVFMCQNYASVCTAALSGISIETDKGTRGTLDLVLKAQFASDGSSAASSVVVSRTTSITFTGNSHVRDTIWIVGGVAVALVILFSIIMFVCNRRAYKKVDGVELFPRPRSAAAAGEAGEATEECAEVPLPPAMAFRAGHGGEAEGDCGGRDDLEGTGAIVLSDVQHAVGMRSVTLRILDQDAAGPASGARSSSHSGELDEYPLDLSATAKISTQNLLNSPDRSDRKLPAMEVASSARRKHQAGTEAFQWGTDGDQGSGFEQPAPVPRIPTDGSKKNISAVASASGSRLAGAAADAFRFGGRADVVDDDQGAFAFQGVQPTDSGR